MTGTTPARSKQAIRTRVLANRRRRPPSEQQQAAALLRAGVLALPEVRSAVTVAAYSSLPGEPGTELLIDALQARGVPVLLPVLQPDLTLGWTVSEPARERLSPTGVREPGTLPSGPQTLASASVVICPGLAGDLSGHRLGRGGGSYDRALASLGHSTLRCLLLYDDEVLDAVPTAPHDQPVDVLVTPTGTLRVSAGRL